MSEMTAFLATGSSVTNDFGLLGMYRKISILYALRIGNKSLY